MRLIRAADWRVPIYGGEIFIKPKRGPVCVLEPNPIQDRLIDLIWDIQARGKPVRIVIPKARQHGISTLTEAIIYCMTAYRDNRNAIIVADKVEHARNAFNMSKLMHDKMNVTHRPETKRSNARELVFSENHSQIVVSTDARSGTYQIFHSSETAYYSNPQETMLGVLQTIPDDPDTVIVMESTGNGYDAYFYPICMDAKAGLNEYTLFFIPWHENPEYSRPLAQGQALELLEFGPYGNEVREQQRYDLSPEQMNWRRYQIVNKCGKDLRLFMQEYPACLEEAFQSSGNPVFDQIDLGEMQADATLPLWRGSIAPGEVTLHQNATSGNLRVWAKPVTGWRNRYVIAADTGGVWEGADYSVAYVLDRRDREVVAMVHGHIDAYEFARQLVTLAKWYSGAKLAIEVNRWESETDDMGNTVISRIIQEVKYGNLYRRRSREERSQKQSSKVGWITNRETKQAIVDGLRQFVDEYPDFPLRYHDYDLIEEMKSYVIDETDGGKTTWNAQKGRHDDRVMAFGILLQVSREMPAPEREKARKRVKTEANSLMGDMLS